MKINKFLLIILLFNNLTVIDGMKASNSGASKTVQTNHLHQLLKSSKPFNRLTDQEQQDLLGKVKELLRNGANLELKDQYGNTALIIATILNNISFVRLFIRKHVILDAQNNDGDTALIIAATNGNYDIARLLVRNNATIDVQNNSGNTALIIAAAYGKIDIVRLLLANGASENIKNKAGKNALTIAQEKGNEEIIDLIKNPPLLKFIGKKKKLI